MNHDLQKKGNGLALLPFAIFIIIYLGAGLFLQAKGTEMAFYQFPSVTAMFIAVIAAFCMGKEPLDQKFSIFAKGAANENVLTMLMIYILAGAFSTVAKTMGGVEATVNLGLSVIPGDCIQERDDISFVPLRNWHQALYMCILYDKWLEPPVWNFVENLVRSIRRANRDNPVSDI